MNRPREFDDILDECIERLLVRGETVEQCLASYPEHTAELKPLLETALKTKQATAIEPRPDFKARIRYQLLSAGEPPKPKRWVSFLLGWQPRWATAIALFLVLVLAGGGTAAAADSSMPNSPLYPVKLATEQVRLVLTPSDIGKTELYAKLADRRVAEIVYMVDWDKPEKIEPTAQRLNKLLVMIADTPLAENGRGKAMMAPPVAPPAPEPAESAKEVPASANGRARLRTLLKQYATDHPAALRAVLDKAPDSARPALRQAISVSESSYQKALDALD